MSTQVTLTCGADLGAIVRQVTEQAPAQDAEHQLTCPYCQAALRSVRQMTDAVGALSSVDIPVPSTFGRSVLERLRAERRTAELELERSPGGQTAVTERLVARLAREAARRVEDVAYASASAAAATDDGPDGVATRDVRVRVRLIASLGRPLPELAEAVRERIVEEVERTTGLTVLAVEVHVDDLVD